MNKDHLIRLYETILLIRESDNHIVKEYMFDQMKTPVHLSIGAEAISTGIVEVFGRKSLYTGTYRSHAPYLAATNDVEGFFAELYGKESSPMKGKAGSMHLNNKDENFIFSSAIVGTSLPIALGLAYTLKLEKSSHFCVCFMGDGATEEGSFWECLNFACLHSLPLIIVVENNGLAIHSHLSERQSHNGLDSISRAFPIYYTKEDGRDVLNVYKSANDLKQKISRAPMPAIIELNYHRFLEHVGVDFDYDIGYRSKPENLDSHDPVKILETHIKNTDPTIDLRAFKEKILTRVKKAVRMAKDANFPNKNEVTKDIFSEKVL